jgi:tetratricopeptide (TPR) repeat protein
VFHLTREILEAVRSGELSRDAFYSMILHHLLVSCETCRDTIEGALDDWTGEVYAPEQSVTDWVRAVDREREEGVPVAEAEIAELLALEDPAERLEKIRRARSRFRSPILVTLLLERARSSREDDPEAAVHLARMAEQVALRAPVVDERQGFGVDLLIEARAHLANSLRVAGDLREASRLLANAEKLLERSADPLLHAEVASFGGSLAVDLRRFAEAEKRLDRALLLYRHLKETALVGRILLKKANLLFFQDRLEDALVTVTEATEHIAPDQSPGLALCAQHNLATYLVELGRHEEARAVVTRNLALYRDYSGCASRLRLVWLEGKIAEGLGDTETAEESYARVQDAFLERGLGYDAALVMLDRAALCLERGDTAAVQRLAAQAVPLFEAQEIHREAFTALVLFSRAAAAEAVNLDQIGRLVRYLREVRSSPGLRAERAS